jgi:UDP-glucose 4-epimerase
MLGGKPLILVTGGAGYVGSHTVLALLDKGKDVVVLDNLSTGHRDLVGKAHLVVGDLTDRSSVEAVFQKFPIEGVFHFAAKSIVPESMKQPDLYYVNNVTGTINLLSTMVKYGVKNLVFSSTAAVYGEPEHVPITEDSPKNPQNVYGHTKLVIEEMLRNYFAAYSLKSVSLRYFNAAGADPEGRAGEDHDPETHLLPIAFNTALGKRKEFTVYGTDYPTSDGTCIRDFIHVSDLAEAHLLAFEKLQKGELDCESFNLGSEKGYSVNQIVQVVKKVTGIDFPVSYGNRREGDPAVLIASSQRAQEKLQWKMKHSDLETIVSTAWAWHQKRFR